MKKATASSTKVKEKAPALKVPQSLYRFLEQTSQSLLIKGEAGTGKTTLALELLRVFGSKGNSAYFSTRVSPEKLYTQFPWLREIVAPEHVISMSHKPNEARIEDVRLGGATYLLERTLNIIKEMEKPFIIFDTWDGIAKELPEVERLKTEKTLLALADASKARVIFISEETGLTTLDYVVDGVVVLRMGEFDGRRIRDMELRKLRGTEIKLHKYLFTLANSRFECFEHFKPKKLKETKKFKSIPHSETHFSTGIEALDRALRGGLPRGSYNLLEVAENVPIEGLEVFLNNIRCNFASQGDGVFVLPETDVDARIIYDSIAPYVDDEKILKRNIRIVAYSGEVKEPYVIPLRGVSIIEDFDRFWGEIYDFKRETGKPVLTTIGYDTVEYVYGKEEGLKVLRLSLSRVRTLGDVRINIGRPAVKVINQLRDASDIHLKVAREHGALIIYGIKPRTNLYNLDVDASQGYPQAKLTPIL